MRHDAAYCIRLKETSPEAEGASGQSVSRHIRIRGLVRRVGDSPEWIQSPRGCCVRDVELKPSRLELSSQNYPPKRQHFLAGAQQLGATLQQVGAGAQQLGSTWQQVGAGAQQLGWQAGAQLGAQAGAQAGAQQLGSTWQHLGAGAQQLGAQPLSQHCGAGQQQDASLWQRSNKPAWAWTALRQHTIKAADKVNHFISAHLHEKFDESNVRSQEAATGWKGPPGE